VLCDNDEGEKLNQTYVLRESSEWSHEQPKKCWAIHACCRHFRSKRHCLWCEAARSPSLQPRWHLFVKKGRPIIKVHSLITASWNVVPPQQPKLALSMVPTMATDRVNTEHNSIVMSDGGFVESLLQHQTYCPPAVCTPTLATAESWFCDDVRLSVCNIEFRLDRS
jgi:hypothetical protein